MLTREIDLADFEGVFSVPPLARKRDADRTICESENQKIIRHIETGGHSRLLYGGNAVFYHLTLKEFETALAMLPQLAAPESWVIPSVGPTYGKAIDQAPIVADSDYPAVMFLPCNDPKDFEGVYRGISEFVERSGKPIIVYIKKEDHIGVDEVRRLIDDGRAVGVKYAIVRENPEVDAYLDALLDVVDRRRVISGIGERPAIAHMTKFDLPGYTTGSGCLAAAATQKMYKNLQGKDAESAEAIRVRFLALEDLRDQWGPLKVLHEAFRLADVADTGPLPPLVSNIEDGQVAEVEVVAKALLKYEETVRAE